MRPHARSSSPTILRISNDGATALPPAFFVVVAVVVVVVVVVATLEYKGNAKLQSTQIFW